MKLLGRVFSFYINSSIHVSLAVLALLIITELEFNIATSFSLYGFVIFGTITAYNFVKYAVVAGLHHPSLTKSLKTIQVFSAVCFVLFLYFGFQQAIETLLVASLFGLLTIFYAIPFLKKKNLRTISGLKIFIVAIVWAGVTVLVPVVASENEFYTDHMITFIQRVLLVVVLTLPFEIRDLPYDAATLRTLPQRLGVSTVKIAGYLAMICCVLLDFFKKDVLISYTWSLVIFCLLTSICLFYAKKKQARFFASFWVESLPICWLGVLLLMIHFIA